VGLGRRCLATKPPNVFMMRNSTLQTIQVWRHHKTNHFLVTWQLDQQHIGNPNPHKTSFYLCPCRTGNLTFNLSKSMFNMPQKCKTISHVDPVNFDERITRVVLLNA
jgi:hypothetical protein